MEKGFNEEKNMQLLMRYKNGDYLAREELIINNLSLIHHILKRIKEINVSKEDLYQEGVIALMKAIDGFDLERNLKFSTYAGKTIEKTIINYIAENDSFVKRTIYNNKNKVINYREEIYKLSGKWPTSEEISGALGIESAIVNALLNLSEAACLDDDVSVEKDLKFKDVISSKIDIEKEVLNKIYIEGVFDILTEREKQVLKSKYGFIDGECWSLEKIGKTYGYTKENARQMEARGLERIRSSNACKIKSYSSKIRR